jgi:hypothetical protein
LLVGEAFVRVFSPALLMPRFVGATSYGIRGNIPLSTYWHYTPEVAVEYRINAQGFRADRDFPLIKPAGRCRILLFGDSFFMGYEVDLTDSFASQLESMIRASGYDCEVINMAVSGFGTAEMLIALKENGLRYSPDLVIFQWHKTDLDDNMRSNLFELRSDGSLVQRNSEFLPAIRIRTILDRLPPYRWLEQNSQLFGAVRERAGTVVKRQLARSRKKEMTSGTAPGPQAATDPYEVALSRALLARAADVARTHGSAFMVFEVPSAVSRTEFRAADPRLSESLPPDITLVSPLEAFKHSARPDTLIYYERGAGHWSPLGNRLAAKAALDAIIRHGYLPLPNLPDIGGSAAR